MPDARSSAPRGKAAPTPLTDDALRLIGARAFNRCHALVLAVSGGADSIALMLLAELWAATAPEPPRVVVATVDHGLRAAATDEARWVAAQATARGFEHHTLAWTGPKPATGVQEAAREARYGLLDRLIERLALPHPIALVLGHHLDDQAETVLMRLARGSGIDGLAGMAADRPLGDTGLSGSPVRCVRPFLDIEKARLVATLSARGIAWLEDPSNADCVFERVRVRRGLAGRQALGLEAVAIATSARRLARAKAALDAATDDLAARAVATHNGAYATIDPALFDAAPEEIRLRLVQRIVVRFGGGGEPPRMVRLEALASRLSGCGTMAATLAGCQIRRTATAIVALREPGRRGLPTIGLPPGASAVWDRRFLVSAGQDASEGLSVAATSDTALADLAGRLDKLADFSRCSSSIPRNARLCLPGFWKAGRLIAAPFFGLHARAIAAEPIPF